jgi:hypothetical protein
MRFNISASPDGKIRLFLEAQNVELVMTTDAARSLSIGLISAAALVDHAKTTRPQPLRAETWAGAVKAAD